MLGLEELLFAMLAKQPAERPTLARVIEVLDSTKRPVAAVADHDEARDVTRVEVLSDKTISMRMLFDPGHSLEERILREQFGT